jgi:hypothetical protein
MSVHQDTGTEAVVYVRLLDEGTDVWRPVQRDGLARKNLPAATA